VLKSLGGEQPPVGKVDNSLGRSILIFSKRLHDYCWRFQYVSVSGDVIGAELRRRRGRSSNRRIVDHL